MVARKDSKMLISSKGQVKRFTSPDYNFLFNLKNGFFARWGRTPNDDPEFSPYGCEILDIEVSTVCSRACSFCYKSNTVKGQNMSLASFQRIIDKMPPTLTQIAIGIGDIDGNPDLWYMMAYCRKEGIIPNITINGQRMTATRYDKLVQYCGAVAVSLYEDDVCYDAVKELTDRGLTQVNIHALLAEDTLDLCWKVLKDRQTDSRLAKLNAIVFLWLKPKGKRNSFRQISRPNFQALVEYALREGISIGFDSCSAPQFLGVIRDHPRYPAIEQQVESCESTLFSYYINAEGRGFPCSFAEDGVGYHGIDALHTQDFLEDVWFGEESQRFRQRVLATKDQHNCRRCPLYPLGEEL
ncbi:MAG: radical SAM protein [Candidatus Heimdallarchaeota archaeon]